MKNRLLFRPLSEMVAELENEERETVREYLGYWEFDPATFVLRFSKNGYEVDLEQMQTSAQVLDWILQIAAKTWATPDVLHKLVYLVRYFVDPQATLCSWGVEAGPLRLEDNPSFQKAAMEVLATIRDGG